ncbi:MAG: hypothetical protein ACI9TH_003250 [Kiritimatiellia bacterium]|jgi:hypothetical protein
MDPQVQTPPTPPPIPQAKPVAPKVFGIINICFGAMGVFGGLLGIVMLSWTTKQLNLDGAAATWTKISTFLGPFPGILLIVAGIGLLTYKRYGRRLSIIYGFLSLIMGVLGLFVTFTLLSPGMSGGATGAADQAAAIGGLIGGVIGGVMGMIYPLVLVIYFLIPKSKNGLT